MSMHCQPLPAMRPRTRSPHRSVGRFKLTLSLGKKEPNICEVRHKTTHDASLEINQYTTAIALVAAAAVLKIFLVRRERKPRVILARSPFPVPSDVVDLLTMARVRCTASIGLLLMLACSITYVKSRDQVDVAGLPVEVGEKTADNRQSCQVDLNSPDPTCSLSFRNN